MPLDIIVCIKQVPDPEHFNKITLDPSTGTITRTGVPLITNPADRHALEEALRLREHLGGSVTALTMGPPQARQSLEEALAMGADKGVILCDRAFAGADTLATACVLAGAVKSLGRWDLILCGNETVDGATGQVPAQLAELLGVPHVTHARKIYEPSESACRVERAVEDGYLKIELQFPAVVAVLKSINEYRLPTVLGIMEAMGREVRELGCTACESAGIETGEMGLAGSPTRIAGIVELPKARHAEMIQGEPEEAAKELVRRLRRADAI
ncbi:MAG: electron transfer flavoprotein subunit beta/FixA family protein [Syntrophaceae bacterium]